MKTICYAAGALLCIASIAMANAAEPVSILGLPLAGKMKAPARICKPSEIAATDVKSACWVSQPFVYENTKSGSVELPGKDALPKWAAHATFEITVRNDNVLQEIDVRTFLANDWTIVYDSIALRFGIATTSHQGQISSAKWVRNDFYAEMLCGPDGCRVKFLSPEHYLRWQQDLEKRRKRDAARPPTV